MPRPIEALIHTEALAHNLARVRAAQPDARVWAVVKANAYGHGIERAFEGLRSADGFALLDLAEAATLRALGWRGPILLLEGAFEPRDLELCSRLNLWHVVHCAEQIDWLAAHKTQQPQRIFLKMNSGMNRLGFRPEAYRSAWARLDALPQVDEISLMTHFSNADADPPSPLGVALQVAVFDEATRDLPGERSLANSAAILRHGPVAGGSLRPCVKNDWVRAGILSYGSAPDFPEHDIRHWDLRPAMTLRSRLIATQQLQPGDCVGYGSTYRAHQAQRIGIVACGYADGYPRHAGTGAPALVDGVRTGTVGRVSMDMLAVDLTPVPAAGIGSEVTLWGHGPGGSLLPIDEVAQAAGTVGYELMCALAARVPARVASAAAVAA
ncbi:MAG: alanine racemase [Rubrivivax sp.]|nr:alanine racemase [Rubrivivax sp.]